MGRRSGGMTGITSRIIQLGSLFDLRKASTTSRRRIARILRWPETVRSSWRSSPDSLSRSRSSSSFLTASAPIPALNWLPYFSRYSRYSFSVRSCFSMSGVLPGSVTIYETKYRTFSSARGLISRIRPMRDGMPLKYQICETGAASSMWPIRSRRTLARVTSTPQRSQTMPL